MGAGVGMIVAQNPTYASESVLAKLAGLLMLPQRPQPYGQVVG
jgi:hypothetical protein